jgi:pimeloyl-ACP methyl ester carboxylesterase
LGDLHGDAARVRAVLDDLDVPVVLVGHSYGGAVITEAGVHPAVRRLVYLCAFALERDESCADAASREAAAAGLSHEGRPDLSATLVFADDGTVRVDPALAGHVFYNDCDAVTTEWALARLGPQTLAALQQTPDEVAWRGAPSTYVVCSEDMVVHPGLQRLLAARCSASEEWSGGHSPFLSQPDRVAALLSRLAAREDR